MELKEVIEARRSVSHFDPRHTIDDATLTELFRLVTLAPSSFNLQHWRFVVVREPANKATLRAAAFDQSQVEDASAVVVVCAHLLAHRDAEPIYAEAPQDVRQRMVPMIHKFYEGHEQLQRDEAIRSASLAAMVLMLAAHDMGLATGPMIGFDPQKISRAIQLDRDHFPVMLVTLGRQEGQMRPRAYRRPLHEVVKLETLSGPGVG